MTTSRVPRQAPHTRQDLLVVALAFAIAFGLSVGWSSAPARALTTGLGGIVSGLAEPALFTISAFEIVRKAAPNRLWVAVLALSIPVAMTHFARAFHPAFVFLAELAWFGLLFSCAREKRTLALWCVVACGACVTGGKLAAARAEAEEPRAPAAAPIRYVVPPP
jgi:hypothetical protein